MSSENKEGLASEYVIDARGLGKAYHIYEKPIQRLLQGLMGRRRKLYRDFWALRGLDLRVKQGETLGIVGRNGSGKSTLLQMIAGTLTPTEGTVAVRGRVAALLELGSGFNPEFTGRENVYLNAAILGLTRAEVDARMEAILAFADIGEFVDQPVRNYSSGMVMRLAFSVMVHVDADILIIDEALSVGDAFFTQKCMRFLREFKERGTLLFVSHDGGAVTGLCDRAIWIDSGTMRKEGNAREVMEAYLEAFIAEREGRAAYDGAARPVPAKPPVRTSRRDPRQPLIDRSLLRNDLHVVDFDPSKPAFGEGGLKVADVALLDEDGRQLTTLTGGETVVLEVEASATRRVESPIVGFYLKDRLGQLLFGDNTYLTTLDERMVMEAGDRAVARFRFDMPRLQEGDYFLAVGVAAGTQHEHVIHHWMHEALAVKALGQGAPAGLIGLPMLEITLEQVK
ncbi:ABC transporter ATP-binding protein [Lysobacter soli]|jgi:lipopolysaccharide transport system ATP-binding protein|uniref:ABC transporter ATP-binding protein n=2 Tax=Lysobacter soli TaxID=453783 RepID=A0A3D8VHI4_9GAMM|nr:ABC transporter ATP-binding protein [Lysobacter soli]